MPTNLLLSEDILADLHKELMDTDKPLTNSLIGALPSSLMGIPLKVDHNLPPGTAMLIGKKNTFESTHAVFRPREGDVDMALADRIAAELSRVGWPKITDAIKLDIGLSTKQMEQALSTLGKALSGLPKPKRKQARLKIRTRSRIR